MFKWHGKMKEVKPHLLPIFQGSNCVCSFCGFMAGLDDLTEDNIKLYKVHLVLVHGLKPEIIA